MDKLELKEIILRHARQAYQDDLDRQRTLQEDMTADALDAGGDDTHEMGDDSNKLETLDDVELRAEITDSRQEGLDTLEQLIPAMHWEVMLGSVVVTDQKNFLVGASVPNFEVFGVPYVGISTEAPLYEALHGKAAGDTVEFRDIKYEIKDVF